MSLLTMMIASPAAPVCAVLHTTLRSPRVHNRTDRQARNWQHASMLLFLCLLSMTMMVILYRVRVPGGVNASNLGWMSPQWLAEFRASHPT
jgi:hypothetical protein